MIPSGDIKILLVEDDEGLRKSLSLFLRCQGYKLLALKTGEQAMEAATRTRYDIILCDYCLSDMNGLEFLRWAGGTQSDAIRVLTAVHGDNLVGKEEAIKGIHGVIRKPFTGEEIQNLLMLLMEGCR